MRRDTSYMADCKPPGVWRRKLLMTQRLSRFFQIPKTSSQSMWRRKSDQPVSERNRCEPHSPLTLQYLQKSLGVWDSLDRFWFDVVRVGGSISGHKRIAGWSGGVSDRHPKRLADSKNTNFIHFRSARRWKISSAQKTRQQLFADTNSGHARLPHQE